MSQPGSRCALCPAGHLLCVGETPEQHFQHLGTDRGWNAIPLVEQRKSRVHLPLSGKSTLAFLSDGRRTCWNLFQLVQLR